MNMDRIREILAAFLAPFTKLKSRRGAAGKSFTYVDFAQVLHRVMDQVPDFSWEVVDQGYQKPETYQKKEYDSQGQPTGKTIEATRNGFFWCVGRLTLPGIGVRDGVGSQVWENEDSPKGAETDAFKRAAVKFGVGLHLYEKDEEVQGRAGGQGAGNAYYQNKQQGVKKPAVINNGSEKCEGCNAPPGRPHTADCRMVKG